MGLLVALLCLAAAVTFATVPQAATLLPDWETSELVRVSIAAAFASIVAALVIGNYRGRLGVALRDAAVWMAIGVVALSIYAYRDTWRPVADRVFAEIDPATVMSPSPGEAVIRRRRDGQFALDMQANGQKLRFVFDTGASTVVLRAEDAARIGIPVDTLSYRARVATANGRALAAETVLDSLQAGSIVLRRVTALVAKPGVLHENLLGQTFLERLSSYSVENDTLSMRMK